MKPFRPHRRPVIGRRPVSSRRPPFLAALVLLASLALLAWSPSAHADRDVQGTILEQHLNNGQGVTVLHVWGSHYEMGYAHGALLADWIQLSYTQMRTAFASYWPALRTRVGGWTFLPAVTDQEFQGMLDGVRSLHPEMAADILDLKICCTFGDWSYSFACRSTSCWADYVEPPFTTISARKLQFVVLPTTVTQQWHHVICAWEPDDGSPAWVNFGFPGYVSCVTGLNEYGTVASLHDWNSSTGTNWPNALPRTMACRWVLTMDLGSDPRTHLQTAFNALQPYHAAAGGFLNYYVPDGGAGVIKSSKTQGFYAYRLPRIEYMNGRSISTNNSDIDGTTGIEPWDAYYQTLDPTNGPRATMEGLWSTAWQITDMHVVEVGFRAPRDMAIWFRGRLQSVSTDRIEWEWEDMFRRPAAADPATMDVMPRAGAFPNPVAGGDVTISIPWVACTAGAAAGDAVRDAVGDGAGDHGSGGTIRLTIFDVSGRRVRVLAHAGFGAAKHELLFRWDGRDEAGRSVPSGLYVCRSNDGAGGVRIVRIGK
jgi:hypothetical protein